MAPYRPQYANDECGRGTRGAWGAGTTPTVYRVTNLNNSGPGSLREALEASEPRVVVFETSGAIIGRDYLIANPYCTIAGQTAPSPGITLQGDPHGADSSGGMQITTHDVVVQHLRIRPGDCPPVLAPTAAHDGIAIFYEHAYNIVIDHCSVSWCGGKTIEAFGIARDGGVSLWRCLAAEALYYSANTDFALCPPGDPSSLGTLMAQNYDNNRPATMAMVGCLYAHCSDRNPEIQGPIRALLVNNLFYDWGRDVNNYQWGTLLCCYDAQLGPPQVDIIGNLYIGGDPAIGTPPPFLPLYAVGTYGCNPGTQLYLADNVLDATKQAVELLSLHGDVAQPSGPCSGLSYPNTGPGAHVLDFVTAQAGARPLDRDAVDTRIVHEVRTKTGTVIASQSEVGGWPTLAVNTWQLVLPDPADEAAFKDLLEEYAIALEEGGAPPVVEPPKGELDEGYQAPIDNKPPPVG